MTPPNGLDEIKALYGDPTHFVRDDGTVSPIWEARMVKVEFPSPLPLGWGDHNRCLSARMNQAIASEVDRVFRALDLAGLWQYLLTYDGSYNWRPQRGSRKLSMHGFGGAMDFNASTNELGTVGDMNRDLVACFEAHGWTWGGQWGRPDPMHFQWASGY